MDRQTFYLIKQSQQMHLASLMNRHHKKKIDNCKVIKSL